MITPRDSNYHSPAPGDHVWAETNFFSFYVPERHLCCCVYLVVRQGIGTAMADVTMFDRLSLARRDCLHVNCQQHLPAPSSLLQYSLPIGLSVQATRPPTDYDVRYDGEGVGFELNFSPLMTPHDIHGGSPSQSGSTEPPADGEFDFQCYKGHFDLSGRVTGKLRIAEEIIPIDCVDTMDHSWGPRPENGMGIPGGCWMHAQFEPGYVIHALFLFDVRQPIKSQYTFTRGYMLENGKTTELSAAELRAVRMNDFGVTFEFVAIVGSERRCFYGAVLSGTNVAWYSSMDIYYGLYRWTAEDGRVGHGTVMESLMMPTLTGNQGLAISRDSAISKR